MKTKIIFPIACSLFFLLITTELFPQAPAKNEDLNNTLAISGSQANKVIGSGNTSVTINKKIQKHFSRNFAGGSAQNWSMTGKNFHCNFYMNSLPACALFTEKGQLIYAITYGAEKNLPSEIRRMLKSEWEDYTITKATEVKQNNRDIWIVNLKDGYNHKTVRIEEGEIELVQKFTELPERF